MLNPGPQRVDLPAGLPGGMSLSARFAITGSIVIVLSAAIASMVVDRLISGSLITSSAAATALYMDSSVSPLAQELADRGTLSAARAAALEAVLAENMLGQRIVSVKLWKPDGTIAYADDAQIVGKRFPLTDGLRGALNGRIAAELDELDDEESAAERRLGLSLLEIYSPIRDARSGQIIAAAEFYEDATELKSTLADARFNLILITFFSTLMISVTLFAIVHLASRTIEQQRADLSARTLEAERVSQVNRELRMRVQRAAARAVELNERYLRRLSADLHDGPAQLVSFAALRMDSARRNAGPQCPEDAETIKETLSEAVREIRDICQGLSLPEIGDLDLPEVVERAVRAHERRTGTAVALEVRPINGPVDVSMKICAYRFLQEGLNNAYTHADGRDQWVLCATEAGELCVRMGNGAATGAAMCRKDRPLGLLGLRERVEVLGGRFGFSAEEGKAVEMWMSLPFATGVADV
jgi:signal transduction histidine kinase